MTMISADRLPYMLLKFGKNVKYSEKKYENSDHATAMIKAPGLWLLSDALRFGR